MRYCLINEAERLFLVSIDAAYMYQFTALIYRLHKEVEKLTVAHPPFIPEVLLECTEAEVSSPQIEPLDGLSYINQLEARFAKLQDETYPVISLLTEIRAFQAQLEYLIEEHE
jgi:hypothetical protein